MGTPNKIADQVDETGAPTIPAVIVDPTSPSHQLTVNSDGSTNTKRSYNGWTQVASVNQSGVASWAGSGDIDVHAYDNLYINFNLTAISGTSVQLKVSRKNAVDNSYSTICTATALTTTGSQGISIGTGLLTGGFTAGGVAGHYLGSTIQITLTLVAITNMSFTIDVEAR